MTKRIVFMSILIISMFSFSYAASVGDYKDFSYTGNVQSYTVPEDGWYELEVYGSAGMYRNAGYGGHSVGYAKLNAGDTLYIVCGGQPYNGGGSGWGANFDMSAWGWDSYDWDGVGPGGGATHIALNSNRGVLSNYNSYRNEILIVAGGGGGADDENDGSKAGGAGGGTSGQSKGGAGGTQTTGNAFGQGGTASGGGWYGGVYNFDNGSGGGSGYIGGVTSWNGKDPYTETGKNNGTGKARITFVEVGILKDAYVSARNYTYDGKEKNGAYSYANVTLSGAYKKINSDNYTFYAKPNSGHAWIDDGTTSLRMFKWRIDKQSLNIPTLSNISKTYNGNTQSPTVNNFDSSTMSQTGTASATSAGSYVISWSLKDSNNYRWTDGSTSVKSASWSIARAKNATASTSNKNYSGVEQSGTIGNYVIWSGTTKATNPGTYKATATPDSNHAWSDGTTTAKNFTWSILQDWNRYEVECITDSTGKPVQPTDTINPSGAYSMQKIIFDIRTQDTNSYTFCVGNNFTKSIKYYNGEQSGIYYWENNSWVKK